MKSSNRNLQLSFLTLLLPVLLVAMPLLGQNGKPIVIPAYHHDLGGLSAYVRFYRTRDHSASPDTACTWSKHWGR